MEDDIFKSGFIVVCRYILVSQSLWRQGPEAVPQKIIIAREQQAASRRHQKSICFLPDGPHSLAGVFATEQISLRKIICSSQLQAICLTSLR